MDVEALTGILRQLENSGDRGGFNVAVSKLTWASDTIGPPLLVAATGDSRLINSFLFSNDRVPGEVVAWLAETESGRFVWMVGRIDPAESIIRNIRESLGRGSRLYSTGLAVKPPVARIIQPLATSTWQKTYSSKKYGENFADDMAIFQTSYVGPDILDDVDQNFAVNLDVVERSASCAYLLVERMFPSSPLAIFVREKLLPRVRQLCALHVELHNIGHFVGPWPFTSRNKGSMAYQPIEEYRACLAAHALFLDLDGVFSDFRNEFALHIFLVRVFSYGLRAHQIRNRTWATTREIITACLFLEVLKPTRIVNDYASASELFSDALARIHELDARYKIQGDVGLMEISKFLFPRVFPGKSFTPAVSDLLEQASILSKE